MGRPSKLSEAQWADVARRVVAGETHASVAKAFGVSKAAVSVQVSKRAENIHSVAQQVVQAERSLAALPISDQIIVVNLASKLRAMAEDVVAAGAFGAKTALRLSALANAQVMTIEVGQAIGEKEINVLKNVVALSRGANDAIAPALGVMTNQKKQVERGIHDELPTPGGGAGVMAPVFNVTLKGR